MLYAQNERIPNGWSGLRACKRDSTRSLFIHVCGHSSVELKYEH